MLSCIAALMCAILATDIIPTLVCYGARLLANFAQQCILYCNKKIVLPSAIGWGFKDWVIASNPL